MALLNPFRPLRNLSFYVIVGLALTAVLDLLSIIIGLAQIVSPESSFDMDEEGSVSVWLMLQGLIYLLNLPTFIFAAVMFLVWLHRAHSNLEMLEARNLQFTSGWVVGWWFIPFANLVKPFQVVREVWWESDPQGADDEQLFLSESLRSAPTYMGFWWGMWLLSNITANITSRVYDPDTMTNVAIGGVLFIVTGVLSMIAAILAMMVVRDITERQASRFAIVSLRGRQSDAPPPPPTFGQGV